MAYQVKIRQEENGYDAYNVLEIFHNGNQVDDFFDNMEPEDARFTRDLSWIAKELERAYQLGLEDGRLQS